LSETFKEFLGVIVFAKPSEEREFMVKALSSHPRNLTKVLTNTLIFFVSLSMIKIKMSILS